MKSSNQNPDIEAQRKLNLDYEINQILRCFEGEDHGYEALDSTKNDDYYRLDEAIYLAMTSGNIEKFLGNILQYLSKDDMNKLTSQDIPLIHDIVNEMVCPNTNILKLFINAGADIHIKNRYGDPTIEAALASGHVAAIVMLMDAGAKLTEIPRYLKHYELLAEAVKTGSLETIKIFIDLFSDTTGIIDLRDVPIDEIVDSYDIEKAKLFINAGALSDPSHSLLTKAAEEGWLELIKLSFDTDANLKRSSGGYPLCRAIQVQNLAIINFLIKAGADFNIILEDRASPLAYAFSKNDFDTAFVLINAGANIETAFLDILDVRYFRLLLDYYSPTHQQYIRTNYAETTECYLYFRTMTIKNKIASNEELTDQEKEFIGSETYSEKYNIQFYYKYKSNLIAQKKFSLVGLTIEERNFANSANYDEEPESQNKKIWNIVNIAAEHSNLKNIRTDNINHISGFLGSQGFRKLISVLRTKEIKNNIPAEQEKQIAYDVYKDAEGNFHPLTGLSSSAWTRVTVIETTTGEVIELSDVPQLMETEEVNNFSEKRTAAEAELNEDVTHNHKIQRTSEEVSAWKDEKGELYEFEDAPLDFYNYKMVSATRGEYGILVEIILQEDSFKTFRMEVLYDNPLLNHPKIQEMLKISHDKGFMNELLNLGEDKDAAKAILEEIEIQDVTSVMDILFGQANKYIPSFNELQLTPQGIFDSVNGVINRLSESPEEYLSFGETGPHLNIFLKIIEALQDVNSDIPFLKSGGHRDDDYSGDEGPDGSGGSGYMYIGESMEENTKLPYITILSNGTMLIGEITKTESTDLLLEPVSIYKSTSDIIL